MPRTKAEPLVALSCRGRLSEVRPALADLRAALAEQTGGACAEGLDSVEIAVAEVLNNIVEHAGPSDRRGAIRIEVRAGACGLLVRVSDDGRPMPNGAPPCAALPALDVPCADLPEGGFGWGLVQALTAELHYRRAAGRNELALRFACPGGGVAEPPDAAKTPD
jgi:serine/threonine-protein kinase RsbW